MRLVTDVFEFAARELPRWNTISISRLPHARGRRDGGAGAGVHPRRRDRLRRGGRRPGPRFDDFAARLSFFFAAWTRAVRGGRQVPRGAPDVGADHARDRFGATNPKSMMCRFHVQTAGSLAHRPVDRQQRRADHGPGARGDPRRRAEPAHELARRGARPADRGGGPAGAPHAADPRPRVGRDRDARPARRLVLRGDR